MVENKFYDVFQCYPYATVVMNSGSYQIEEVNLKFESLIMDKKLAEKLNFSVDLLQSSEEAKFISIVEELKHCTDKKEICETFNTLTKRFEQFPIFVPFKWRIVRLNNDAFLLTGEEIIAEPDTTERKKSKINPAEFIDFFQNAPIALHWLSGTGNIIWANETELRTLGYTADEYIGHSVLEFCPDEVEAVQDVFAKLSSGKTIRNVPFKFRAKNGDAVFLTVDSNVSWNEDGTFKHTRCFIRNDVDRRIQDAIYNENVKKTVLMSAAKDKFIRKIFHEIKTPLHILSSSLQSKMFSDAKGQKSLCNQVESLVGLVDDLSFATMFDSGNITATKDFREDSFTNMITNTVDKLNELENLGIKPCRYNLQLDHSITNAFVNVDITFFRVLSHLLSNAFRFGDQAYPIIISITRTGSTQLSEVNNTKFTEVFNFKIKNRIKSNDTCNLISINKCFQTYFHFDVTTANIVTDLSASLSSFEGLGLGLYVAYNKLQLLGSLLECSIKNDECCFSFSLALDLKIDTKRKRIPSNTPPEVKLSKIEYINVCESNVASIHMEDFKNTADTNTTTTIARNLSLSSCSGKRRRILVVDDSAICRKVLSKMLKQYNYDYDEACNGQEACDMMDVEPCIYDAVFMDLRMPIMDGLTATRICKQKNHLKMVPIIIVTAELGDEVRKSALEAHANSFINKPAKAFEMLETLNNLIPVF